MKTIWDWLEIDCTTDGQKIKKAYASQAKKYHPEDNPEEFKQLRSAYKTAMKYASSAGEKHIEPMMNESVATFKQEMQPEQEREEEWIEEKPEYTYSLRGRRDGGREKEEELAYERSEYIYSLGDSNEDEIRKQQGNRREQQHFVYGHENFDSAMRGRLQEFLKRIDVIYTDNFMYDDINAWKLLFRYYEFKPDFKNPDFVAAIVEALEQMTRIPKNIRNYIDRQLFSPKDKDVKMLYLRERYRNQRVGKARNWNKEVPRRRGKKDIAKKLFGKESKVYKRFNYINSIEAMASICFLGVMLAYAFGSTNENEKSSSVTMPSDYVWETNGESADLKRLEVYKKIYTKDKPFVFDVSGDDYADIVYYDGDTEQFVVEEYDPTSLGYIKAGNVKDYCEKNPKARIKLFRFLQEDK